ncbi:peptide chain release factor N(5)-glutamine methyltransferase [Candidatus Uhrbacteria bacterium]|nr:peptide chain release factor N(5)-glutamine methyltransferase [Candidatus Uhrbacteria bacterium]
MPDKPPSSSIRSVVTDAARRLQPKKIVCEEDRDLGRLEAEILLAHVLKKDRAWLHTHSDRSLPTAHRSLFQKLLARRLRYEPIAYITGEKEFYGLPFFVDKRALIPRPESELLVDLALHATSLLAYRPTGLFWDVGTGTGAIAIAIAKHLPKTRVFASDISASALTLAKKNAKRHKTKNLTFLKANLLDAHVRRYLPTRLLAYSPLIITANLPYLPESDKKTLDPDVVEYEPSSALFAGKDGLELIEKFLRQLASSNTRFSHLFLEYDPPQTKKLRALAKSLFPSAQITVHKDLAGRDRVLHITRDL